MAELLSFKQSELTLFRGICPKGVGILILVAKDKMVISTDFGDEDPWVFKTTSYLEPTLVIELEYIYVPLNLSGFKNLTKIW